MRSYSIACTREIEENGTDYNYLYWSICVTQQPKINLNWPRLRGLLTLPTQITWGGNKSKHVP